MTYLVPAAQQLLDEIEENGGKADVVDDVDGLGFNRSIRLTTGTATKLGDDVLEALESDARVQEVVKSSKGVRITFVATPAADYATPFGLASVV